MSTAADEAGVRATLAELTAAIGDKDARRAVATYAGDVVAYDLAPPLAQDRTAARDPALLDQWFATWSDAIELVDQDLHVEVDGDLAAAWTLRRMTGTKHEGGAQRLWYRSTAVLRRAPGGWRIAHMHDSVPFAMDGSGRALLDLQP